MNACIIIPTLNEAENIAILINKIKKLHSDVNIVVVDGKSKDGTCDIVENILVASCRVFDAVVGSSALIVQKAQSELKLLDINGGEKETKTFEGWFIRDIEVANIDSDGNKDIILGLGQIGNRLGTFI